MNASKVTVLCVRQAYLLTLTSFQDYAGLRVNYGHSNSTNKQINSVNYIYVVLSVEKVN